MNRLNLNRKEQTEGGLKNRMSEAVYFICFALMLLFIWLSFQSSSEINTHLYSALSILSAIGLLKSASNRHIHTTPGE